MNTIQFIFLLLFSAVCLYISAILAKLDREYKQEHTITNGDLTQLELLKNIATAFGCIVLGMALFKLGFIIFE